MRYSIYLKKNLLDGIKVNEDLYVSNVQDLTLGEFVTARTTYCRMKHCMPNCKQCTPLISFANSVLECGLVPLSETFRKCFSSQYKSSKAVSRVMQLPVVIFRVQNRLFVVEYVQNVNYEKFVKFLNLFVPEKHLQKGISRENLKMICELASSEKDKKLIRFAATGHLSATMTKKEYGISNMNKEKRDVTEAKEQYKNIKEAVNEVVSVSEKMSLKELGILFSDTESSSVDEDEAVDSILPSDHSSSRECEIVTDSESDNPEDWVRLTNLPVYSNEVKAKIKNSVVFSAD